MYPHDKYYSKNRVGATPYNKQDLFSNASHKSDKSNPTDFHFMTTEPITNRLSKVPLTTAFDISQTLFQQTIMDNRKVRTPTEKLSTFKNNQVPSGKNVPDIRYFRRMKSQQYTPHELQSLKHIDRNEQYKEYFAPIHNDCLSSISMEFRNSGPSDRNQQICTATQFTDRLSQSSDYYGDDSIKNQYYQVREQKNDAVIPEFRTRNTVDMFKKLTFTNLKETTSTLSTVKLAHRKSDETLPKSRKLKQSLSHTHNNNKLRIEDFDKIKQMGKGKFGSVYMVRHRQTGFLTALKVIKKKQIIQEKLINQLARELKIHAYLTHPNIIDFYGSFQDKENVYILLELGSEGQLYTKLKQKETYSEEATAFIIKNLLESMQYMHNKKLLHRDIKPENIVVVHVINGLMQGAVKLCDFGWAVFRGNDLRTTFCGTPLYVSPEILMGQPYGEHTDIWAIGILTYELMIGTIPFDISREQELSKIITEDIKFPSNIELSDQYKDFVLKILRKNPTDRMRCEDLLNHPFIEKYRGFQTCEQLCDTQ